MEINLFRHTKSYFGDIFRQELKKYDILPVFRHYRRTPEN
jgi:hypothetical protein